MTVTFNGIQYVASINQKGIGVTKAGSTRIEAIVRCWQEYNYYLFK